MQTTCSYHLPQNFGFPTRTDRVAHRRYHNFLSIYNPSQWNIELATNSPSSRFFQQIGRGDIDRTTDVGEYRLRSIIRIHKIGQRYGNGGRSARTLERSF